MLYSESGECGVVQKDFWAREEEASISRAIEIKQLKFYLAKGPKDEKQKRRKKRLEHLISLEKRWKILKGEYDDNY